MNAFWYAINVTSVALLAFLMLIITLLYTEPEIVTSVVCELSTSDMFEYTDCRYDLS